ncbi:hypothetical protein ACIPSJ_27455 [Streptomyces sp. NPDC090088]|uniref:hypothetical protein n=1 Tax=Streptomyces sp. NPDC090088 TaxID=3365944 RepID=UPI003803AF7F
MAEILEESGHHDEAIAWYWQAAESGYPSARSALTRLSATGTPSAQCPGEEQPPIARTRRLPTDTAYRQRAIRYGVPDAA